jgi:CubicO group peptidase (beta-lactamase class C family)
MERFGMHGAVLVEKDGEIVLRKGYGLADRAQGRAVTAATIFDIGSLAKQFTAAAMLALQAEGRLDVADTIAMHLDDVPPDKRDITIHQLLTHTSGLPYQNDGRPVLEQPLSFEPGARWSYSNPGYQLLGQIITRTSGQPFATYLRERIFAPAGMHRTCCVGTRPWTLEDAAHAYTDQTDQGSVSTWTVSDEDVGPGGVASSVGDLYRWEQALRSSTVLPETLTALLFTEHARNPGSRVGYGYGWMLLETIRGTRLVMHQGNYGGFNADYRRYLEEGLTIIFLSNHFIDGQSMRDAVVNRLSMLINGGGVPEPPVIAEARDLPAGIAGAYGLSSGESLAVAEASGGVRVTPDGQAAMNLLFAPDRGPDQIAFIDACNERTERFFASAFARNPDTARELVSPALPFEGAWDSLQDRARDLTETHGAFTGTNVVGTALAGDGRSGRSFAYLRFERGQSLAQLTWGNRGVLHITLADGLPAREFLAGEDGDYVAFDIFSGRRVSLRFADSRMVICGDDGTTAGTAERRG